MGPWAPLPEAELKEHRRKDQIKDDQLAAAHARYLSVRQAIKPSQSLEKCVPRPMRNWVRGHLNSPESLNVLAKAEIDHQWAVYDRSRSKRPLYPRPRALSPSGRKFDIKIQRYDATQSKSSFFKLLPPELRAEIYRAVFGDGLLVDITAGHGGFGGPPPSKEHRVFLSSKIQKPTGEVYINGYFYSVKPGTATWRPHIIPLLQSCRKIYDEAIPILYGEMVLKSNNANNSVDWAKFLLRSRLETIRVVHFKLQLGYPWEAQCFGNAFTALLTMKGLQKLCILGNSGGMIDCDDDDAIITNERWQEKKTRFLDAFRQFNFVKQVDIFLPISKKILAKNGEEKLGHVNLHGLTDEELAGSKAVFCACKHLPERMALSHADR